MHYLILKHVLTSIQQINNKFTDKYTNITPHIETYFTQHNYVTMNTSYVYSTNKIPKTEQFTTECMITIITYLIDLHAFTHLYYWNSQNIAIILAEPTVWVIITVTASHNPITYIPVSKPNNARNKPTQAHFWPYMVCLLECYMPHY